LKFLLDGMLGKLARWLRMLGQDVEYKVALDDAQLLFKAKTEQQILLTRDFELYQRAILRGLDAFFLEGETESNRLSELAKRYGLPLTIDMNASRCPRCNGKLKAVPKDQIKSEVEPNTFTHYDSFWQCPKCGHVYWQGAHWEKINNTLKIAEEKLKEIS
jgi:uncharacterized protein